MSTADLASELGQKSRELAEAIKLLPKLVAPLDRHLQLKNIEQLRAARDEALKAYRAATVGEGA